MKPIINLLLDSGAFSAFTQKTSIDINKYADFALANRQHLSDVVSLDVIMPGDTERAGRESLENFLYLKHKRGLMTMPVFHVGEPLRYLDRMLDETGYIGLSSSSIASMKESFEWYDSIFPYVTDSKGYPIAKFHAFGDASQKALLSYPWYSADSSSWWTGSMRGGMFVNEKKVTANAKTGEGDYINTLGFGVDSWEKEMTQAGINTEAYRALKDTTIGNNMQLVRGYMNALFFLKLRDKVQVGRKYCAKTLVSKTRQPAVEGINLSNLRFHFVLVTAIYHALVIFAQLKVTDILFSYYYCKDKEWNEVILPYLYDPIGTCKSHPKLKEKSELLSKFLLNPIIV